MAKTAILLVALALAGCEIGPTPPPAPGPSPAAQLIRVCGAGAIIVEDPDGQAWLSVERSNGLGDRIVLWDRVARAAQLNDICKGPR